jgi:glyoxylase-like metal-dependent hydrolase (beta-lactamase superfamily II)
MTASDRPGTHPAWICRTCGVQHESADQPPHGCHVCLDERQYVPATGQAWTTLAELARDHQLVVEPLEPGVWSLHIEPSFAIGQRAFLIQTAEGNLLWDCLSLLTSAAVETIREIGGIRAMAISHPHYYAAMADWSNAFGGAPVWLHEGDRVWLARRPASLHYWSGARHELFGGLSLVHSGGHFDGFQVAHWPGGAEGRGVLFAGDQPQVCLDGKWVTFMYSYPNWTPFGPTMVRRILSSLEPLQFDRLYGAFGRHLSTGAKDVIDRSARRYLSAVGA